MFSSLSTCLSVWFYVMYGMIMMQTQINAAEAECKDIWFCIPYKPHCGKNPRVRTNCKKTCGLCASPMEQVYNNHLKQFTSHSLSQLGIEKIKKGQFNRLIHVTVLELYANKITHIDDNALTPLKQLQKLSLTSNRLTRITAQTFNGLRSLAELLLGRNLISSVAPHSFSSLEKLETLDLSRNKLKTLTQDVFSNGRFDASKPVMSIYLRLNPLVCDSRIQWMLLSVRRKRIKTSSLPCKLANNVYKNSLYTLNYSQRHLKHLPKDVPASAKNVTLNKNSIKDIKKGDLRSNTQLEVLHLAYNLISKIEDNALSHLKKVKDLDLTGNFINTITAKTFNGLSSVRLLFLTNNWISSIASHSFSSCQSLQTLSLYKNKLRTLSEDVFQKGRFDGSKRRMIIAFDRNPWVCDGRVKWIPKYMNQGRIIPKSAAMLKTLSCKAVTGF